MKLSPRHVRKRVYARRSKTHQPWKVSWERRRTRWAAAKDDGRGAAWKSIATRYTPSTRCWPRESVGSMAWDSLVYLRTAEVTGILKDVFMS